MNLHEKYRPRRYCDVIGQAKAVATVERIKQGSGLGGSAYWISGKSGTGKTTLAKLIAGDVAEDGQVDEIDGASLNVATVEQWQRADKMQERSFLKLPACHIVNESHRLNAAVQTRLLEYLENIPANCAWIFTTTNDGQTEFLFDGCDSFPLLSRCFDLSLSQRGLAKAFADRAREIAQSEGLDGQPIGAYLKLANDCKSNFRAMLSRIQAGAMLS